MNKFFSCLALTSSLLSVTALADDSPLAVFHRYEAAVEAGDINAVKALIADDVARPPFARCDASASDHQCLIDYIDQTVVSQHSKFTTLATDVKGDTVSVKMEVRNDLTRAAGVDRLAGTDRIKVKNGKIIEFGFYRDEQDQQTAKFFAFMMQSRPR